MPECQPATTGRSTGTDSACRDTHNHPLQLPGERKAAANAGAGHVKRCYDV